MITFCSLYNYTLRVHKPQVEFYPYVKVLSLNVACDVVYNNKVLYVKIPDRQISAKVLIKF